MTWPRVAFAPGLENTQHLPPSRPVTFGATREYADEEGWIMVERKRQRRRRVRRSYLVA